MDVERLLEVLKQENALLRERVASLEAVLVETSPLPIEWRLTMQETRVFGVLVNRELATKEAIMAGLYFDRGADEVAEPKIVDVFVCKMRRKLRPFGVEVQTIWGQGYALPPQVRQRYRPQRRAA